MQRLDGHGRRQLGRRRGGLPAPLGHIDGEQLLHRGEQRERAREQPLREVDDEGREERERVSEPGQQRAHKGVGEGALQLRERGERRRRALATQHVSRACEQRLGELEQRLIEGVIFLAAQRGTRDRLLRNRGEQPQRGRGSGGGGGGRRR